MLAGTDAIGTHTSKAAPGRAQVYETTATRTGTASALRLNVDTDQRRRTGSCSASTRTAAGSQAGCSAQGRSTRPTAGAWNSVPLAAGVSLTSGNRYWIAVLNPRGATGTLVWRDRAGRGGASRTAASATLSALPATWSTGRAARTARCPPPRSARSGPARFLHVPGHERGVAAAEREQLLVGAALGDPAAIEDHDLVRVAHRGEAVRDDDRRAALGEVLERFAHGALGLHVEGRRGLVEHEHGRVAQDRAGDRDPLLLAAGEAEAALADDGLVAVRELDDLVVDLGGAGGFLELFVGGARLGEAQVLAHAAWNR